MSTGFSAAPSAGPRPPSSSANRRVLEALQLFSEIENVPIADVGDSDRIRATGAGGAAKGSGAAAPQVTRGQKSAHPPPSNLGGEELRHKLSVADAIMKRLHKKNQELISQLESAQRQSGGAGGGSGSNSETALVAQLRRDIALRDREIQALRQQLLVKDVEPRAGPSPQRVDPPPLKSDSEALATLRRVHEAEKRRWSAQYQQLVDTKLELIAQGESTGKVNKEVKAFFVALKQKLVDDAIWYEASRALQNEMLLDAEFQLASTTTGGLVQPPRESPSGSSLLHHS